ncbi:fungal-specific transcription factor domain-containing protein [Microdochium bolleyi]|uniref:Fungal-specific transcription factor domain-containing protein n=1 Tax=Microdochium bolleyi TaxID=196109 RepID=A0A136II90_9PEZI|nr:fungal-specific transcription factor domain-containing protein [Microdochium bolleyi]
MASYVPTPRRDETPANKASYAELACRVQYLEGILKHERPDVPLDTDSLCKHYHACLARSPDSAHEVVAQAAENVCDQDCELEPRDRNSAYYSGEFSYWTFSMKVKRHVQARLGNENDVQGHDTVPSCWRPLREKQSTRVIRDAVAGLPPRFVATFLAKVFFAYAQKNFFFVQRDWFQRKLDVLYRESPGDASELDAATVCIIFGVLAAGTQYAHMDSSRRKATTQQQPGEAEDEVGNLFYESATRLLPEVLQSASLESVQAITILGFYAQPLDAPGLSYVYFSLATRLAIQNGMHRRYQGKKMSPLTIETRNRVWWSVCSIEKKIAIFHGRPPSLLPSDIDADLPRPAPDIMPDDGPLDIGRMVIWTKLIQYLGDFLQQILVLRKKTHMADAGLAVLQLAAMRAELKNYWDTIPRAALDVAAIENAQAARSCVHLRLLYCLIRMFVGRPFLSPGLSNASVAKGDDREAQGTGSETRNASERTLVDDAIAAACEAASLCWDLYQGEDGLSKGSFIEHNSCRAFLLVLIAYSIQNRTDTFRNLLQQGLLMVRDLSSMGDLARAETSLIEDLHEALGHLLQQGSSHVLPEHAVVVRFAAVAGGACRTGGRRCAGLVLCTRGH